MKNLIIGLVVGATITYALVSNTKSNYLPNDKLIYGEVSGLPKNCRAIIKSNIDGYKNKAFTPDEIIESIDRNCGENGYSWVE